MPISGQFTSNELASAGACDLSNIARVLNVEHDLSQLCSQWGLTKVAKMLHEFEADVLAHRIPINPTVPMRHFLMNNCANDFHIARWHRMAENIQDYVLHTKSFLLLPSWLQVELRYGLDSLVNQTHTFFAYTGFLNSSPPPVAVSAVTKALGAGMKVDKATTALQDHFLHPKIQFL